MTQQDIKNRRIDSIEQLKVLAKEGLDCFILLCGGLRSSKYIRYDLQDDRFYVLNLIDGSEQKLTESQLLDSAWTHIGQAITQGALFAD